MAKVLTKNYELIYGEKPNGRKIWKFKIGDKIKTIDGSYKEAKKKAIDYAHVFGVKNIFIVIE